MENSFKLLGILAKIMPTEQLVNELEEAIQTYRETGETQQLLVRGTMLTMNLMSEDKSIQEVSDNLDKVEATSRITDFDNQEN